MQHLLILVSMAAPLVLDGGPPDAFRRMSEARSRLMPSGVEWTSADLESGRDLRFKSQYARNGDICYEEIGDSEGWTRFDPATGRGVSKFPKCILINEQGAWNYSKTSARAENWPGINAQSIAGEVDKGSAHELESFKDIRCLGMVATDLSLRDRLESIESKAVSGLAQWEEATENGLSVVRLVWPDKAKIEWGIDPQKGWNPAYVTVTSAMGDVTFEAVSTLKQFDGVWFPEQTDYFAFGKLRRRIALQNCIMDSKRGPARISVPDIGIEPGVNVRRRQGKDSSTGIWEGAEVVSIEKWLELLKSGARKRGASIERLSQNIPSPYATPEQTAERMKLVREANLNLVMHGQTDLWSRYVEEFVQRFGLDTAQLQKATQILIDCKKQAQAYITKNRDEIVKVEEQLLEPGSDDAKKKALKEQQSKLQKPVEDIFEEQLQPRLETIPTRAQRTAAEAKAATTRPAEATAATARPAEGDAGKTSEKKP